MFTGIVEEVGTALAMKDGRMTIGAALVLDGTRVGDSINVNGTCLTVVAKGADRFEVDVVPETLRRTNLGALRAGDRVNLERAMAVDGRFGGHMVQGHIEGTAELLRYEPDGADGLMTYYRAPTSLARYIVAKGFIAIDGASLTVVGMQGDDFWVTLIPFTREHTNLADGKPGDRVNLETDVVARYVERLMNLTHPEGGT